MLNEIAASDGALVGVRAFTEQHQRVVRVRCKRMCADPLSTHCNI
jgi:hypothetical protein